MNTQNLLVNQRSQRHVLEHAVYRVEDWVDGICVLLKSVLALVHESEVAIDPSILVVSS